MIREPAYSFIKLTYLQGNLHLGGLVTFSLPQGTVIFVPPQEQVIVTVSEQG